MSVNPVHDAVTRTYVVMFREVLFDVAHFSTGHEAADTLV